MRSSRRFQYLRWPEHMSRVQALLGHKQRQDVKRNAMARDLRSFGQTTHVECSCMDSCSTQNRKAHIRWGWEHKQVRSMKASDSRCLSLWLRAWRRPRQGWQPPPGQG